MLIEARQDEVVDHCYGSFAPGQMAAGAEALLIPDVTALECASQCGAIHGTDGAILIPAGEDPAAWVGECNCVEATEAEEMEGGDMQFALLEECQQRESN